MAECLQFCFTPCIPNINENIFASYLLTSELTLLEYSNSRIQRAYDLISSVEVINKERCLCGVSKGS